MADQRPQNVKLLMLFPHAAAAGEGALNGLDQLVLGDRLRQQVLRAGLDDLHRRWDVCMPCEKDNRQTRSQCVQTTLQLRPAHAGDLDVEENAARSRLGWQSLQQLFCRLIDLGRIATGAQESTDGGPEGRIVIYDVNDRRHGGHPRYVWARGRLT